MINSTGSCQHSSEARDSAAIWRHYGHAHQRYHGSLQSLLHAGETAQTAGQTQRTAVIPNIIRYQQDAHQKVSVQ